MVDAQVARDGRGIDMRRAGVRNAVVVGAVVLSGLLAGETGAAFRNPDGVAVIIGNRAYKYDVPQVTYAHRDAEAFRRYVVDVLGFDPENVIHKKDADKATMERVFGNRDSLTGSELWRHLHPDGLSDLVVFYSGHGIPGLNDKRGYLLPVNAHPDTAELNGYPIDVLYENLVKLKQKGEVRSVHVFLDACFSGDSGGGMLIGSTSAIRVAPLIKESASLEKLTILTAASGKEVASWDKTAKHGLFTHHLLNALYGEGDADANGEVTAAEVKAHLDRHMTRAARRIFGRVQNAELQGVETAVLARAVGGMFPVRPLIGQATQTGHRFRDCPTCPEMVVVPAGSYEMGSPASEAGRNENEGPVHRVTIAQPFAVGVYEVTRGEFGRFVEATGYSAESCLAYESGKLKESRSRSWRALDFQQTDQHPVVCVNWEDAQAYVRWLSQETGQAYRLLSEAEWEYVARAGTRTVRYWGQGSSEQCRYENGKDMAWTVGDGSRETVDCNDGYVETSLVGMYEANPFGLHDVLGNVTEWVQDCWNESYSGAPSDGRAWQSGDCDRRVLRGGSWGSEPRYLRSASRGRVDTGFRVIVIGFRVARTLTGTSAVPRGVVQQQEAEARQQAEETRQKAESRKSLLASLIKQQMVHVEGGAFTMGCTKEQSSCLITEKPVHRVRVRSFEISKYEVTQTLWEAVLGENPSRFDNCALCPVEKVSWKDIQTFLKKLNNLTGERYRLPTEAEWEYAARGGQQSRGYKYAGSNEPGLVAWYDKNSGDETHPVGQKAANELGLYDMSGNLWEWVQDCWHHSYAGAPSDGEAWQSGSCSRRVVRGGSWLYDPRNIRSAVRYEGDAEYRSDSFGFRVARTLTDSAAMPQAADQQHEDEALQLALESIQKWEFKSSIEIENPDLQSSGCADTSVTDSSGRSLKDIADQWGYEPEEAYAFGLRIQEAVREKDLAKFFSLVDGELEYGPRRKYAENKAFRDIFPDSWRSAILNDEPPCTPVGWRGFMLANGLVKYKAPSEDSDTFRLVAVHDWVPEKFPPVPVGWKVDDRLLPPTCFEYKSDSGDNFEAFAEQFSIADYGDFSHNTGKYFGDPIYPFKDNTAGNIWRYVGDCARDMAPDQLQISDSRVEYVYPSGGERLRYRILADVSPNLCQNLAPNLPGKCLESYLVDVDYCGGSLGCRGPYTIYGMFQMRNGERIIFPLKNFRTENPARNFLDSK